jgi:hypothetical protein
MPEAEQPRKTQTEPERVIQMEKGKKEEMWDIWMMMKKERMRMMRNEKLRMLLGGKRRKGRRGLWRVMRRRRISL